MSSQPSEIEREIEQLRDSLSTTIDQLLVRAHPKTIVGREVASIKGHYVDAQSGEPRTDNILKTVSIVVGTIALLVVVRRIAR